MNVNLSDYYKISTLTFGYKEGRNEDQTLKYMKWKMKE